MLSWILSFPFLLFLTSVFRGSPQQISPNPWHPARHTNMLSFTKTINRLCALSLCCWVGESLCIFQGSTHMILSQIHSTLVTSLSAGLYSQSTTRATVYRLLVMYLLFLHQSLTDSCAIASCSPNSRPADNQSVQDGCFPPAGCWHR